jgi:hypothetical protein
VVVSGTTRIGSTRVVIVDLGGANLADASPIICRQAAALYRESLSGERLRVQRHRGSQPAVDGGHDHLRLKRSRPDAGLHA